jgi:TRAP-type C4-dicarboxylate transport system substrate-binding protein
MRKTNLAIYFMIAWLMIFFPASALLAAEKKINIKMAAVMPPQAPNWDGAYALPKKLIEMATNGRAKVTIYPSQTLVPVRDFYRATQEGINDVTWVWAPAVPGAFPVTDLFSLPGFSANQSTSNQVVNRLLVKFPEIKKQFSPKVKHISTQVHMRTDLHSAKPIRSLADIKGKVIACQDEKTAEALSLLGASATKMQVPDMYTALERGTIAGTIQAWGSVAAHHIYEVAKYHTLIGIGTGTSHWMWYKKTWDKFTPEEQAKLELLAPWLQNAMVKSNIDARIAVLDKHILPEKGQEMIIWSEEDMARIKESFEPLWEKWAEEMEAKGYPGRKIIKEAIRLLQAYSRG